MKYNERPCEIDIIVAHYEHKYKMNDICIEFSFSIIIVTNQLPTHSVDDTIMFPLLIISGKRHPKLYFNI